LNPEFSWFEDFYGGRYARIALAYNNTDDPVTLTLTGAGSSSAYIFTVGDVIRNSRTGENMVVVTIASAVTITAKRAFGTTAAATGAAGDGIFIVGNVNEENSGARNVNATQSSKQSNYTQIFKTSIALSNTEREANLYGGKDIPYQRAKRGTEHCLDIERAFWWSQKKYDTSGLQGHPRRSTGGMQEFIEAGNSYVQVQGGPLTAPDLNTWLREGFTYGNDTKMVFAGGIFLQAVNEIARGQILMRPLESTYGMKISQWQTAFGTVNIVHNPLFVEDYAGYAYMLDMESFAYRYMNNRDTTLQTNIQAPDMDGEVDQYLTECGLQRAHAAKHALIKGITS
jgi:hypothetical protein